MSKQEPGARTRPAGVEPRLVIRLLGEVAVALDGRPVPELTSPRMQRLLALVALAPDLAVRRDRLALRLWPDSTGAQARTNLRKLLHDLRRSLPGPDGFVEAGAQTIRWKAGPSTWIDVVAFTDALARGDPAAAVRHYGGDLLPDCPDDWVLAERERLRRLSVDALAELAGSAAAEGRDADAVDHAHQLLRIDPLHEPAYRLLMTALARRGRRSEALRTYQRCVRTLDRELGVAPEPATTAVYDELRRPAPAPSVEGGRTLIGRAAEWHTVSAAWQAAVGGAAHLLLVTGEPGIGKTRLVEELARRAAAEGHAVVSSRAYQAAGGPPWGPVIDWLRSDPVRPGLDTLADGWRAELARLLPELRAGHPQADAGRRHHLLDAVRRGLLARGRPLLLILDDLQWCDSDSLELCGFVLQRSPAAPVLVAGTARDEEVCEAHPLAWLRRSLGQAGALTEIALGPLGPGATAEMAAAVSGKALDAAAAARLWKETGGNPLFVVEAVRAGFGESTARPVLTPTVHAMITARLQRLRPDARRLVEVAATIGRAFTIEVLAAAMGRTEDELADTLGELWQRHILCERGPALDFSHDTLREVALELISPARRRLLHRSVAVALERHHAEDLAPVSARLGAHYESAGLVSRAVEAYERAATHAYRVFALDDAITVLERALRLLADWPISEVRDAMELRLRSALGVPLVARRGYGAAAVQHSYERALTLHRRLGRRPSPAVLRGLALHAVATCRFDRAAEMGGELVAAGSVDHTALVEGEYVLGVTGFWRGEFAAAERHLTAAIDEYRPEEAPLHIARYAQDPKGVCLSRLALTRFFRGDLGAADRTMRAALRCAAELGHPMTTGYVRAFAAILATLAPEAHDLPASVAALAAITSTMHIGYFETIARMLGGWRDVLDGDLGGIRTIREVTDLLRREQRLHLTLGLSLLAQGFLRAGDPAGGRSAIADALHWTTRTGQCYLLPELLRVDAELLALRGERTAAVATARRAVDAATAQGAPWLGARSRATLVRVAMSSG
ncbi:ATP-binding protein [Pseudonocardia hispaniensis]|uniref:ATP-binding protein n=1 Tax=Pseudonocardia hispaniensis TaxID=904933 RepID=A0ABW1J425_9PSEU